MWCWQQRVTMLSHTKGTFVYSGTRVISSPCALPATAVTNNGKSVVRTSLDVDQMVNPRIPITTGTRSRR